MSEEKETMSAYTAYLRGTRGIEVPGVQFSGPLTLVQIKTDLTYNSMLAVVHVGGGHYWSTVGGTQPYAPATFRVWRLIAKVSQIAKEDIAYKVEELFTFPVRGALKKKEE